MFVTWLLLPIVAVLLAGVIDLIAQGKFAPAPLTVSSGKQLGTFDGTKKSILVTGGSNGVGSEAAIRFAELGAKVIITGRSQKTVDGALARMPEGTQGLILDLTSPDSIASFETALRGLLGSGGQLDIILWNAGTVYPPGSNPRDINFGDHEVDWMVTANHLGHFSLIKSLLPDMIKWGTRSVFTSSISHHLGSAGYLYNPSQSTTSHPFLLYGETKLMNVLTAMKLQRLFDESGSSASSVVATPGFCATKIMSASTIRHSPSISDRLMEYFPLIKTAETGGNVLAYAATVDTAVSKGRMLQPYWIWEGLPRKYLDGVARGAFYNFVQELLLQWTTPTGYIYAHKLNSIAYNEMMQDKLWSWSEKVVGSA